MTGTSDHPETLKHIASDQVTYKQCTKLKQFTPSWWRTHAFPPCDDLTS